MKVIKNVNPYIFRGYDVRGVYPKDINADVAYTFGKAFGTYIKQFQQEDCVVGYDNRFSSEELVEALIKGITSTGTHVVSLGLVTTPMYYYAQIRTNTPAGVMVTASHNPKDENGFKFSFDERGNAKGEMIQEFYRFLIDGKFDSGNGIVSFMDIKDEYYQLLLSSIEFGDHPRSVLIDCGNGTTSFFAPEIFSLSGIIPVVLYGNSDPSFPNHHPDPTVASNLEVLSEMVVDLKADIGIAFDGDGDRVGVVDEKGRVVPTDQLMIAFIRDIAPRSSNKRFLYDVKCSRTVPQEIERLGGESECYRTGNSYTRARVKEGDFVFGGELSGHLYFRDRFPGFDSGIYAGLRILEILTRTDQTMSQLLEGIPKYYATEELKFPSPDDKKMKVIERIKEHCLKEGYTINDIDGVRVELTDGWALVRASNTGPNITARFEGKDEESLRKLKDLFTKLIEEYNR